MPLYRRLPKRGFNPISKEEIAILNLDKIQSYIDKKNINPNEVLNSELLKKQNSPKQISSIRNIKISEVIEKRG